MDIICCGSLLCLLSSVASRPKTVDAIFQEQILIRPVSEAHDAPGAEVVRIQLMDGSVDVCEVIAVLVYRLVMLEHIEGPNWRLPLVC